MSLKSVKKISFDIGLYGDMTVHDVYEELERYMATREGYINLNTINPTVNMDEEYKEQMDSN